MPPFLRSLIQKNRGIITECLRRHSSLTSQQFENMDKKATWDRFYAETNRDRKAFENFEWFFGFSSVRDIVLPLLPANAPSDQLLQVLDLGCGTSALGPSIFRHCPVAVHVTCADISPVAVELMRVHARAHAVEPLSPSSRLEFIELDCTRLHERYRPGSVDLIVDKGTIDALLRSKEGKGQAGLMLRQCLEALRRSGSMVQFSDEDPDARLLWLETEAKERGVMLADVGVQDVGELGGVCYYCYHLSPRSVVEQS
ncbi:citrate synthase-lysine N-methyltransferase CSKMT, mitochondrial [Neosynchiropus ocellatus]